MLRHLAIVACLATAPALAQEQDLLAPTVSTQGSGPALGFTLRGGVAANPSYFGSNSVEAGPDIGFNLNYLRLGGFTIGDPDPYAVPEGFGLTGSFRYIGERSATDDVELTGLADVDDALELGVGLRYATRDYQVYGNVRYGVIGHEAFVGELGADVFLRPSDRLTLRAGPRAFFGDSDYASTYYGVTAAESAASAGVSNFAAFNAGGGLLSSGVELGANYQINETWGIDAALRYDRLRNDAANSPITIEDGQVSARIGVTRRFTLGF